MIISSFLMLFKHLTVLSVLRGTFFTICFMSVDNLERLETFGVIPKAFIFYFFFFWCSVQKKQRMRIIRVCRDQMAVALIDGELRD